MRREACPCPCPLAATWQWTPALLGDPDNRTLEARDTNGRARWGGEKHEKMKSERRGDEERREDEERRGEERRGHILQYMRSTYMVRCYRPCCPWDAYERRATSDDGQHAARGTDADAGDCARTMIQTVCERDPGVDDETGRGTRN